MSVENARAALVAAFTGIAGVTIANTEYDNQTFTPLAGAAYWHKVHYSPNVPVAATCGADGEDEFTGFLQITCHCPSGKGEKAALDRVKLILDVFKTGSKFTYSGQEVMVTSAGRANGFTIGEWYRIPVTIFFLARHNRNTPT